MPEMKVGRAHRLCDRSVIEILVVNIEQRRTIDLPQGRDVTDYAGLAIALDGQPIFAVPFANQNDSGNREVRFAECSQRQKRVIDRTESSARGNNDGKPDAPHQVAHQITLAARHEYASLALHNPFVVTARVRQFKSVEIDSDFFLARCQVWRN